MTIGQRAVESIKDRAKQNGRSENLERISLDITESTFKGWRKGHCDPSAYYLQQLALNGYDVMYILTGQRHKS